MRIGTRDAGSGLAREPAADLLHDTDHKVIVVAMAVGREGPPNFSRTFRRFSGMRLREFRRAQSTQPLAS